MIRYIKREDTIQEKPLSTSFEERRLKLEESKYELELQKFERERRQSGFVAFINNNLGIVVSAIVGIATIVVSTLQLRIASNTAQDSFFLEQSKFNAAIDKDQRAFAFDFAKFLLEKQTEFNTTDVHKLIYLRNIVIATLPDDLATSISHKMADASSSDDARSVWLDGFVKLRLANAPEASGDPNHAPFTVDQILISLPQVATPVQKNRLQSLMSAAGDAGLTDPRAVATFLSLVLSGSDFLGTIEENLDYSSTTRIIEIYSNRINQNEAAGFVHQPEALANRVYANRAGNYEPGDGWRYRGRGFLQTFGRAGYQRSGDLIGVDLVTNPDALLDNVTAAREAVALFKIIPGPQDDIANVVRRINGGVTGLAAAQSIREKLLPGATRVTDGLAITGNAQGSGSRQ